MNDRFHRAAVAEHLDQVVFYESRLPGLGADYLAEFEAVMAQICTTPTRYPLTDTPDIRKAGLKRFPFHVIYRVEPARIVVLAIAHQRRRPTYWVGRVIK
jgi:toxin ParE1/3/4